MIGTRGHDICGKSNPDILANKLKNKGFKTLQLVAYKSIIGIGDKSGEVSKASAIKVREAMATHGVSISMLGAYFNPLDPDPSVVEEGIKRFTEYLSLSKEFDCQYVGTETGSLNKDFSFNKDNGSRETFNRIVDIISRLCTEAEKFDTYVAVEAVWCHSISSPEKMKELIDSVDSKRMKVIFDPVNVLTLENYKSRDSIIERAFKLFGDKIVLIHAKDFIIKDNKMVSTPIGKGIVDYVQILKFMDKYCSNAPIIIEELINKELEESRKYISNIKESYMNNDKKAKLAVVGLGNMGSFHLKSVKDTQNTELVAVCDINKEKADKYGKEFGTEVFYNHNDLLKWGKFDGIIIATPHYDHTVIAIDSFKYGFHVLTEKPVGVHSNDIKKMILAWEIAKEKDSKIKFAAMFQQRTLGQWKKIKDIIDSWELGKLVRATWLITDWFRTQHYYDNGDWRATWKGEGGGVLLNQCPHQLDLFQWFVGMPDKITGFASIGKYHDIEVEDEVTGYLQYNNGMVGHFITTTGESPGTNRLEIVGEMGKIIFENDVLKFYRNRISMLKQLKESKGGPAKCENWEISIPYEANDDSPHRVIIENFADAIINETELVAPAIEGIHSVSLGNGIMLSQFQGKTIDMPIDSDLYEEKLMSLIANSTFCKKEVEVGTENSDIPAF